MDKGERAILVSYLKGLADVAARGDAREESFYPALADLIREVARATSRPHIQVTVQPRPTEAGNPDFRVWDGRDRIIGYVEAKRPAEELLDRVEDSDQFRRYRETFPNLILTNFLEFRLYRDGERVEAVRIGQPRVLHVVRTVPPLEHGEELWALLERFLGYSLPSTFAAESLAVELAKRTRFLRDIVLLQMQEEGQNGGDLWGFYEAFQKYLMGTLTEETFADLYAQTITYGLFAARTRTANGFNRRNAFHAIPRTIGVLRDLFRYISLGDLPTELEWIVDDIAHVLAVADVSGILSRNRKEGNGGDPIVYFYEPFLARYNPEERERRGVYYTPEQVVSYIVRSLHRLLKEAFQMPDGLASSQVTLLDPAAGTMTFVARAAREAVQEFEGRYGSGARAQFIRDYILRNFYAFELMVAPYAVGHLKMGFFLEELGYPLAEDERVPFYLTNSLDMSELERSKLPGLSSLAEESHLAGRVKRDIPILVILGNPPYSGHSANQGDWIRGLIGDYKQVDGKPLGEKNPKWLQDDYVKFLRFAEWKIAQAGRGVVGMITNHSYLDNPTFRGMRWHLMQTFDEIYILDLHGNSLKREACPDGSKDENVFDIRQGVAIAFFVKWGETPPPHPLPAGGEGAGGGVDLTHPHSSPHAGGQTPPPSPLPAGGEGAGGGVYHADLWGLREQKYAWLETHDVATTPWQELKPGPPFYLFKPRDARLEAAYYRYPAVPEIFPVSSVGVVTARDRLTIHWTPEEVWTTVQNFSRLEPELARQAYNLGRDARDWKVALAQEDLHHSGPDRRHIVPILYRPFDVRYTYYTGRSRGFHCMPRPEVMHHMLAGENVALIAPKQHKGEFGALVTKCIGAHKTVAAYDINYYFPLHLYPTAGTVHQGEMFEERPIAGGGAGGGRR
ncbi:MAG: type ISP restriction/modification enzyme, partial [Anaerolineae bacterium]